MVDVAGIEVDPTVVFAVAGAVGGLVTTLNWRLENPTTAFDAVKLVRNVVLGAVSGLIVDTSALAAFTAGLAGEFIVQNAVSKVDTKVGVSEKIPQVKSLVQ